ncbi:MAG: Calx-beta domain-containing protein [Saprospiraceae bacterium]
MKKLQLLLLFCLFITIGFSQVIAYSEDFTGQENQGAIGPGNMINTSMVDWTVDVSAAILNATTDWFKVTNSLMEGRDVDGPAIWNSPSIDISTLVDVSISIDISGIGGFESSDYIKLSYIIDNGPTFDFGTYSDDFAAQTVTVSGLSGMSIVVVVEVNNGAAQEKHRFDNVLIEGMLSGGSPAINLTDISGPTNEDGTSATFDVVLNSMPTADVVLDISSDDTSENTVSPMMMTFTMFNWDTPQTVTVAGIDDADFDGDQTSNITVSTNDAQTSDMDYNSLSQTMEVINVDDEIIYTCLDDISCAFEIVPVILNSQNDNWQCTGGTYTVNGFTGIDGDNSELWLIYGDLEISNTTIHNILFDIEENYDGSTVSVLYTESYTGCPSDASNYWVNIGNITSGMDNLTFDLSETEGNNIYVAIKYESDGGPGVTSEFIISNITIEADVCPTVLNPITSNCEFPTEVQLSTTNSMVDEDDMIVQICVDIINPSSTTATTVMLDLDASSTTVNGMDYNMITFPYTITFAPGELMPQCLTVEIIDDSEEEPTETIVVNLSNPMGGGSSVALGNNIQQTISLNDNDMPIPTVNDVRINELDCDTQDTDSVEFIELWGTPNFALDGIVVVFFNATSSGTGINSYASYDLDNMQLDANGFFIIGKSGATSFTSEITLLNSGIQNGADGVGLYFASSSNFPVGTPATLTNLIDALVYDTNDADANNLMNALGVTEQIDENEHLQKDFESIQRGSWFVASPSPRQENVLPVKLISFKVVHQDNTNVLSWVTASEINNEKFEVERSNDGTLFENIGTVRGIGNTYNQQEYTFNDTNPTNGINYYRLKQIDFDGKYEYSTIIKTNYKKEISVRIYPNVTNGQLYIDLNKETIASGVIMAINGNQVKEFTLENSFSTLDISNLQTGVYIIQLTTPTSHNTIRIFKN